VTLVISIKIKPMKILKSGKIDEIAWLLSHGPQAPVFVQMNPHVPLPVTPLPSA
jgi:hypothetical protein